MDAQWIKSPAGHRVLEHWADPRPSWLWLSDGHTLMWRNAAAGLFGKARRGTARGEAAPIKGQVARLIRLGSFNRPSLARMQFIAGDRPLSATCACTPLQLPEGQTGLLVVAVDPAEIGDFAALLAGDVDAPAILPRGMDYLLRQRGGTIAASSVAAASYAPRIARHGLPPLDADGRGVLAIEDGTAPFGQYRAGPDDFTLLLFDRPQPVEPALIDRPGEALGAAVPAPMLAEPPALPETALPETELQAAEPLLPLGLPPIEPLPLPSVTDEADDRGDAATGATQVEGHLSSLFDRLLDDAALFEPLGSADDRPLPVAANDTTPPPVAPAPAPEAAPADKTPAEAVPPGTADVEPANTASAAPQLYRVVARRIVMPVEAGHADAPEPPAATIPAQQAPAAEAAPAPLLAPVSVVTTDETDMPEPFDAAQSPEAVERVSRYNFDELSRILTDRVGLGDQRPDEPEPSRASLPAGPAPVPSAAPDGSLVMLGGETLVLNRLPLGILVFRDQQVLFANRAITEMVGYDSVESLRRAGLGAMFPAAGDEAQQAGPVNHLVQRDGTLVPVTARLQSVSWQGRPALMLSASTTEVRTGHEGAVRAFAELLAESRSDGFIETNRAGVVSQISPVARQMLELEESQIVGRPVSQFIAASDGTALRLFLERPARFAETARPAVMLRSRQPNVEIQLFAQGQAGIVSGYFGFVRQHSAALFGALGAPQAGGEPELLERLSRGVRRPLNTVIGFSDLITSAAFGPIENARYVEYARDIKTAGLEIASLVDELDDFARLRDGRYTSRPTDIDLGALLESSVTRVRAQANAARILVRSAISERLPRVRADRASLAQAVLNLLASAIDQTPQDGSVVLSAQVDETGGVAIHVRDSSQHHNDLAERFVVFRDGPGRDGEAQTPVPSSVGLALTRALAAVNAATLDVEPTIGAGTLFSLTLPAENVVLQAQLPGGA